MRQNYIDIILKELETIFFNREKNNYIKEKFLEESLKFHEKNIKKT